MSSALVELLVEAFAGAESAASEEVAGAVVDEPAVEDPSCVSGKGGVPFWVEALLELDHDAEQFEEEVFVLLVGDVHAGAHAAEAFVDRGADERFGVVHGVLVEAAARGPVVGVAEGAEQDWGWKDAGTHRFREYTSGLSAAMSWSLRVPAGVYCWSGCGSVSFQGVTSMRSGWRSTRTPP